MTTFKNKSISLGAVALFASTALTGCGEDGPCGPCGIVAEGAVSISGSARLDGFFGAVADLDGAFVSVSADFDANIRGLAAAWDFDIAADAAIDGALVGELMADIRGQISGSISGGISLNYVPPRCSADISLSVDAQASCEVQAGCEVEASPGEVSVSCEGTCSGGCSAECSGAVSCEASVMGGGFACEGTCEGSCALEVAAACDGTCSGTCEGSAGTQEGFEGACDGMCQGTCEMGAGGSCEGECNGSCVVESPSADFNCNGEPPTCRGECGGECSGSCEGTATPPSASVDCDASADCQASASASGSANLTCTPPSLELAFNFNAELAGDINAQAAFRARISELQVRGAAILQGFAQLRGVIGEADANGNFQLAAPLLNIQAELNGIIEGGASGDLFADIPIGRINCVIPAMVESVEILADLGTNAAGTISAQAAFSAEMLSIGG